MFKLIKKILFFKFNEPQIILDLKSINSNTPPDKVWQIKTMLWSKLMVIVLPFVLMSLFFLAQGHALAGLVPFIILGVMFGPPVIFVYAYQSRIRRGGKPLSPTALKVVVLAVCLPPVFLLILLFTVSGFNTDGSSRYLLEDLLSIH